MEPPRSDEAVGSLIDVTPAKLPGPITLRGRYVNLVPLDARSHGEALWRGSSGRENEGLWRYLFEGPFPDRASFDADLQTKCRSLDPFFLAIVDADSGHALGRASYMRIEPQHRVMEVGHILYLPALQRTAGATEAMYLMARHAFENLGVRRYEWKCNALNEPSRRAALRFGFTFEGVFRQHMIAKGRNRDTAWYSMLDSEWGRMKSAFEQWLDPANFDANGKQMRSLATIRQTI